MAKKHNFKKILKKTWHFIWEDDSILSWLVNIVLAFVLIKFIVYPGLGFLLTTSHPIVAVVSNSMEHPDQFDVWWDSNKDWYLDKDITKENFLKYSFRNGFNRGDIMVLKGKKPKDIEVGEVIVFRSTRPDPIIHRIVDKWEKNGIYYFQTKGDNNKDIYVAIGEDKIEESRVIGKALFRVPLIGYVKIWFVELIKLFIK